MRLVEDNARAHIYCNVVNCLREEDMNMPNIRLTVARCGYWVND